MNSARAAACLLLTTLLTAPLASATPKAKARGATRSETPAAAKSQAAVLNDALERHLADAGLSSSLAGYTLSPSVVQLRRYVEARRLTLICVVDLSIRDEQGTLLATVRGNARSIGASPNEAIDSATHAAVGRLPQALQALRGTPPSTELAQARRQWGVPLR